MKITKEIFEQQRLPRFGTANPERIQNEFWKWMIRGDGTASKEAGGEESSDRTGIVIEDGKIRSAMGAYFVRQLFGVNSACGDGPIWTFNRFGATCTELPDGRIVCVGGEHEDFYDPDFCIYNDVVVLRPDGEIEIYGYPREIFPPTDFHTATLVADKLVIVGSVGYKRERSLGKTPVYGLDLSNYCISEIQTSGSMPGWISRHTAEVDSYEVITVRGGRLFEGDQSNQRYVRNIEEYALDLRTTCWKRVSNRNWRQFSVWQKDGKCFGVQPRLLRVEDLVPESVERAVNQPEQCRAARILVKGVPVLLDVGVNSIEVVIEGALPDEAYKHLGEAIRSNAEAFLKLECVLCQ
jgi:hypothetical protein